MSTIPMFEELPVYADDLEKALAKKRAEPQFKNMLPIQMNRLMTYKRVNAVDIHKAVGTPHPTLSDWINFKVDTQMLGDNVKKVANYFGVTVDFLVYGTPMTEYDLQLDDAMPDLDERTEYDDREAI